MGIQWAIMGLPWAYTGPTLGLSLDILVYPGPTMGMHWAIMGLPMGLHWTQPGPILGYSGLFWAYPELH